MGRVVKQPKYTGTKQPPYTEDGSGNMMPYLPSEELIDAVNIAICLEKRPLLVKGDPGCGKTRLARAVAYELDWDYEEWHVKSTSRASDGLYTFDAVLRLHDAHLAPQDQKAKERVGDLENYVHYGPLGRAFLNKKRAVVLIDEIDKADIDFPNDLLLELDEQRFTITEKKTDQEVKASYRPLVFITSNDEKDLPDAFLRRCLFHYIEFPKTAQLQEIVRAHFPKSPRGLIEAAVRRFEELRERMKNGSAGGQAGG